MSGKLRIELVYRGKFGKSKYFPAYKSTPKMNKITYLKGKRCDTHTYTNCKKSEFVLQSKKSELVLIKISLKQYGKLTLIKNEG